MKKYHETMRTRVKFIQDSIKKSKKYSITDYIKEFISIKESDYKTIDGKELISIEFRKSYTFLYKNFKKQLKNYKIMYYGSEINGLFLGKDEISEKYSDRRVWFIDIETDNELTKEDTSVMVENADKPISSIQVYDTYQKEYFIWILIPEELLDNKEFKKLKEEDTNYFIEKGETEDGQKRLIYFDNEYNMLNHFLSYFRKYQPNVISGWFSNFFDMPYIINRLDKLFINLQQFSLIDGYSANSKSYKDRYTSRTKFRSNVPGVELIDYQEIYEKYAFENPSSWSLDFIASLNGVGGKTESKGFLHYRDDFDKFVKYIIQDVKILIDLEKKKKFLSMMFGLQKIIHIPITKMLKNSISLGLYFNQIGLERKTLMPGYSKEVHDKGKYKGAIVFPPESEVYSDIIVLDYASLYPNSAITINSSPETLSKDVNDYHDVIDISKMIEDEGEVPGGTIKFKQKELGFIPEVIDFLLKERLKYKKLYKEETDEFKKEEYELKQLNYKILINSIYGVLGYKRFALYNRNVAESITAMGRTALISAKDFFHEKSFEMDLPNNERVSFNLFNIYGDTDSIFLNLRDVQFRNKETNKIINRKLTNDDIEIIGNKLSDKFNEVSYEIPLRYYYNDKDSEEEIKEIKEKIKSRCGLRLDLDKQFKRLRTYGVKKRYFGYGYDRPEGDFEFKPTYHGVELARNDTPKAFQNKSNGGEGLLQELFYKALDKEITDTYLYDLFERIKNIPIENLYIPKKVNTVNFDEYKILPNHIRSLLLWKDITNLEFDYGDKLLYFYVKMNTDEYDENLRERFNITKKTIKDKDRMVSITIEFSHLDKLKEFHKNKDILEIDYYTLFNKQILEKLKQFDEYIPLIKDVDKQLKSTYIKDEVIKKKQNSLKLFDF